MGVEGSEGRGPMRLRIGGAAAAMGGVGLILLVGAQSLASGDDVAALNRWLFVAISSSWLAAILLMTSDQARLRRVTSWLAAVIHAPGSR